MLASIDTWRGRSWPQAAFQPPRADDQTGTIELPVAVPAAPVAADGEAAPAEPPKPTVPPPPLDPGSTVFVFEDVPAQDGGRYLGAFLVQGATFDAAANRVVLTVTQTEARDAYDSAAWKRNYDSVTVYDSLPADSWLAFSKTAERGDAAGVMPVAEKLSIDQVETLLEARDRQRAYLVEIEKHDEAVEDRDEWPRIRERLDAGEVFPGSYWAVVTFKEPYAVAEGAAAEDAPRIRDRRDRDLRPPDRLRAGRQGHRDDRPGPLPPSTARCADLHPRRADRSRRRRSVGPVRGGHSGRRRRRPAGGPAA